MRESSNYRSITAFGPSRFPVKNRGIFFAMKDILKGVMYGSIFTVPFVLLIVSGSLFFPYITGKNFAFRLLVEVGFASWLLLALYEPAYRPRWSWILASIASLVGVMFFANLFGEYAPKSFWSNYERMEGWITLLHFFLYFLVLGSVLSTEKLWSRFFNVSLAAAGIMSLYALGQVAGVVEVSQGTVWRVDGRLGNSSYLGVYMLFQMFIAAWLYLRTTRTEWKVLYGGLFILFAFVLFHTGTRGATLGLVGGGGLAFLYLAYAAPAGASIKKWALGALLTLVVLVGGLISLQDTSFVKENAILNRFTNISLSEGSIRFAVWQVALEGVKEHPILGWGQENFNYVFNKYYNPALYAAEPWYDRTHNIFLDWLIAGGIIGLLAYLSILVSVLWAAVLRPAFDRLRSGRPDEKFFKVTEQALILGLLAAYTFHNLFVFDNLASWIFYAIVLALVHQRVARPLPAIEKYKMDKNVLERMVVPSVIVLALGAVYFVNVPGYLAAQDIIDSYRVNTVDEKMSRFQTALNRGSFADQEITEQFAQSFGPIVNNSELSTAKKLEIVGAVEAALEKLKSQKPGDARIHLVSSNFYRMTGDQAKALAELNRAAELSPRKPAILEEIGLVHVVAGNKEAAVSTLRRAYELDTRNNTARVRLAAALVNNGQAEEAEALIGSDVVTHGGDLWYALASDQLIITIAYQEKRYDLLRRIMSARVEIDPTRTDYRINLAAVYYETRELDKAVEVLEKAIEDIPSFKTEGQKLIDQIKSEQ